MEFLLSPWLPPVLLVGCGIYLLSKATNLGQKIGWGLMALVGGLHVAFRLWSYLKHLHR